MSKAILSSVSHFQISFGGFPNAPLLLSLLLLLLLLYINNNTIIILYINYYYYYYSIDDFAKRGLDETACETSDATRL